MSFAVFAYHYLRHDDLLCNFGRHIIGRDYFLRRYAVRNLPCKLVVVDFRICGKTLFGKLFGKTVGKLVVIYVIVVYGKLFVGIFRYCGGSNLVVEGNFLFLSVVRDKDIGNGFGNLCVINRAAFNFFCEFFFALFYLRAELFFQRSNHGRKFYENVFALCGEITHLALERSVFRRKLFVNGAALFA